MATAYTSPQFDTDNQYLKFSIHVWEDGVDIINNKSKIAIDVVAWRTNTGYTTNYGGGCGIKIDGVEQASQYWNWGDKPITYQSDTVLYYKDYWWQSHDSNGTKTMNIAASCWWYSNGSIYIDSAWQSYNVTLTPIDRGAPTVTISTSNVGVNSFSLSASASTTCDVWQRSIDNGSTWTQFSTTAGTSASTTVTGLSPNTTYNVKVRARRQYNQVYGTSGTSSVKTIGNSVLNSVTTVTADNATVSFTINATVYVPSYTHKLEIKNGNTSILTKTGLTLANGNNTITLTSSERTTLLNAMANIKNFTGTFNLSTWSGSTQIGSTTSKTATVQTTAANSAPTFTGFTYVDGNSTSIAVTENNQILIGGISTIAATATAATAKNSATIKSYSLVFGSTTASSTTTTITTGTITNTGTVALTVSAIDSRGYSTSQTVNVTSLPYSKIVFKTNVIRRVNEVENTIQLAFTGEMKDITINNVDKNSLQVCQYRYKKTSDNSYGSWTDITSGVTRSGNNLSYTNNSLTTLDANYSWNLQVNMTDRLTSDTVTLTVGQGTPLMSWRTKKVGINERNPDRSLDVKGSGIKCQPGGGVSYISGCAGNGTGLYVTKDALNQNHWIPGMTIQTKSGGGWSIGNYDNDQLQFAFGSKTNIDNNNNSCDVYSLSTDGSFNINASKWGGYSSSIATNNTTDTWVPVVSGSTMQHRAIPTNYNTAPTSDATANRVMSRDGNGDTKVRYIYTTYVYQSSSDQTTTCAGQDGYVVYCNSDGWFRKAKAVTSLYSGTYTSSGSITCSGAYKRYNYYVVQGQITGNDRNGQQSCLIPSNWLSTSDQKFEMANEDGWYSFKIKYSGTNVIITFLNRASSAGCINRVWGII